MSLSSKAEHNERLRLTAIYRAAAESIARKQEVYSCEAVRAACNGIAVHPTVRLYQEVMSRTGMGWDSIQVSQINDAVCDTHGVYPWTSPRGVRHARNLRTLCLLMMEQWVLAGGDDA